jgi:hypothetical protein
MTRTSLLFADVQARLAGGRHRRAVMARSATKSIADDLDVARPARHVAPDGRFMRGRGSGAPSMF